MPSSKDGDKDQSRKPKIPKRPEFSNGGSLEDCTSNVFSLLDLPGIKWKCFRTKSNAPRGVPLTSDLVLKAYSNCVTDGILCAWRRKQLAATGNNELLPLPHFSNDTHKELWVFWYDDEPPKLQQNTEGLECDEEVSLAAQMNIVSYEVRTILFKALHIVLERDLTKDKYVRFGRWFTIPVDAREHYLHFLYPTYCTAIKLNFFVHGPHTVCATVQAQRQPTLLVLARRHLEYKGPKPLVVIVGPWSMRGVLVQDQMSLLADPKVQEASEREWNHWKKYLQMEEVIPEVVPEEKTKSPEPEQPQPPPHRALLEDSSDEETQEKVETENETITEDVAPNMRWMYEPDYHVEKAKELTSEEKVKRDNARERRRKRRKEREERRKELERQRADVAHADEYDSDVVTDPEDEEENPEVVVDNDVPKMVLLEIDGVRMLYPSKFICATLEGDRQVLESLGLKTTAVPEELHVPARRPRNRRVVSMANPILRTMAVWQHVQKGRLLRERDIMINRNNKTFGEQPLLPIRASKVFWNLHRADPFTAICDRSRWKKRSCVTCKLQRLRKNRTRESRKVVEWNVSRPIYNKMADRVQRKRDFDAYHKKLSKKKTTSNSRNAFLAQFMEMPGFPRFPSIKKVKYIRSKASMRRLREKQKVLVQRWKIKARKYVRMYRQKYGNSQKALFDNLKIRRKNLEEAKRNPKYKQNMMFEALMNEEKRKEERRRVEKREKKLSEPSTSSVRGDSDDEMYQMDKLCLKDWANVDEEHPDPLPEIEHQDFELYNGTVIERPEGESDNPSTSVMSDAESNKKQDLSDSEQRPDESEMTDEQNQILKDRRIKLGMYKADTPEHMGDPQSADAPSPHSPKDTTEKPEQDLFIPMPAGNKFFRLPQCKGGLRAKDDYVVEKKRKMEKQKERYLARWYKKTTHHKRKMAKYFHKLMDKKRSTRSLEKTLKDLRLVCAKDTRSEGTKQQKFSKLSMKKKQEIRKKTNPKVIQPKFEDALNRLNMNWCYSQVEKAGPYGTGELDGMIFPNYEDTPHCVDEASDSDGNDQRNGLGEGTSDQYSDGEAVDQVMNEDEKDVTEPVMDVTPSGNVRTVAEHVGPDGILSPPASNEMPKGGPLSVGPPSVESQGLNQIYPTPPSVQMLQGDSSLHSPQMQIGKMRLMPTVPEEEVERLVVPGGVGTIVEIEADDPETENMKYWNKKISKKSKLSHFLATSCNDPVSKARKVKNSTPITDKFTITDGPEKVTAGMIYKPMLTRNFDAAPPRLFASLVRERVYEKRIAAITASSAIATAPPVFPQQSPIHPVFQSPLSGMHVPSPSLGSFGHPQMGNPGYPGTPGPFPPTTPTYPMGPRPGSSFGLPGPGYPHPHQMMGPSFPGQVTRPGQFVNPQSMMSTQQIQVMRYQMMQNRQANPQGMQPPVYGGPGMPHPYPPGTPGYGMPPNGPSSVQQLNNFVNQSRFGSNSGAHPGAPPPYGMPQSIVPQSPMFNQPHFGGNGMMSPMQQHQLHQQQMHQQMQNHHQMQQQHHQQMQRNQMQIQQMHPQQPQQPTPQLLQLEQQALLRQAYNSVSMITKPFNDDEIQLTMKQKIKFNNRQNKLLIGLKPKTLQPLAFRNLKNPPDANTPIKIPNAPIRPPETNIPEGDSLTIAIILSDTILDLHFDSVFDSCPICSCSVSIRSRDLGMYITPHEALRTTTPGHSNMREHTGGTWSGFHVNNVTICTCGFSAIRHRYLSCSSGLFPDDANEATTLDNAVAAVIPPLDYPRRYTSRDMQWYDSKSIHDLAMIDQIRTMSFSNSLGKAVSQMATIREHRRNLAKAGDVQMDISVASEYILSHVDLMELLMLGNSAVEMSLKMSSIKRNKTMASQTNYFHPWGLQVANEIEELDTNEWNDLFTTLAPTITGAMKQARKPLADTPVAMEGPLTWKKIVMKNIRGRPTTDEDEDYSLAEPIPAVMRSTEKEAIRTAPHIDQYYDQAGLGPVDQPKDVMYIAIIPDDYTVYENAVNFMDKLSETYERMRLGKHIPFPVSTTTATRFRKVLKEVLKENPMTDITVREQQQEVVQTTNQKLKDLKPLIAEDPEPAEKSRYYWKKRLADKLEFQEELDKGPDDDFNPDLEEEEDPFAVGTQFNGWCEPEGEYPDSFYEREGILKVGTLKEPMRTPWNQTVTNTVEFNNMTKHLTDKNGFVSKLRLYLQQMEDMLMYTLNESLEAFERSGYRYQLAVEARRKRIIYKNKKQEEELRYEAAKDMDEANIETSLPPDEGDLLSGVELGTALPEAWVNDERQERKMKKIKENDQYPQEGLQAPSPIPAGMVHIPETLSSQEQKTQPTLTELFADPSSIMPHNAQNITWKKKDTSVPNPFPLSNQKPIPFEAHGNSDTDAHATLPHVIVIYMMNPFQYGPEGHTALHMRIAILAFIRTFNSILNRLPLAKRPQLQLEIIGLESMDAVSIPVPDYFNNPRVPFDILNDRQKRVEGRSEMPRDEIIRSLSVAVYTHPRVFTPEVCKSVSARCMTAFGPGTQLIETINNLEKMNMDSFAHLSKRAKTMDDMMNSRYGHSGMMQMRHMEQKNFIAYRVPSNIVCLASPPSISQVEENGKTLLNPLDEQTLFISYCLIGTDFLVATATDAQGKLIDNCVANLKPKRQSNELYRYKFKTQILDGMGKLWSFILGVMASDTKNWRLVVGRLGRIGHGEFRAWTHLLNKTSLLRYSGSLKDICGACRNMPSIVGTPAILSACLTTLEPEPTIRIMHDIYDAEVTAKKNLNFQTPSDISCTHILTFPVGAEINLEVQDQTADTKADENWEFGDLDIMEGLDDGDTEIMKDLGLETPSSAAIRQPGGTSMFFSEDSSTIEIQNQPLASGYYISTAPAPELPNWFWASCPSSKRQSPVHLKSSLHIHIGEVKNDDIAMESTKEKDKEKEKEEKDVHPLESRQTEEVLRHVLESYNALSWLNLNRQTGERYSCLPIHIQHLLRLYHSVARLLA